MVVERAFGLLKGRFRILHKQQDTTLHNVCHVVTACCILHNYGIAYDDEADDDWLIDCEDGNDNDEMMMMMMRVTMMVIIHKAIVMLMTQEKLYYSTCSEIS